jgi:hypothetical protein
MTPITIHPGIRHMAFSLSIVCLCVATGASQASKQNSGPRIGLIKDYKATGLMTGCGNLYFYQRRAGATDADYVFLARGDGSNAWMNLNGRDVRLRLISKSATGKQKPLRLTYRYGDFQITVVIEHFKPKTTAGDSDPMYQMNITARRGTAVRVARAVGDSDC